MRCNTQNANQRTTASLPEQRAQPTTFWIPFPMRTAKGRSQFLSTTLSHIRALACVLFSSWNNFPFLAHTWPQPFHPLNLNPRAISEMPSLTPQLGSSIMFCLRTFIFSFTALTTFLNYCIHYFFPFPF